MGKKKKTKEEFIKEARKVHGDKYDYSKIEYVNNATKVTIICPKHGHDEFWQTPKSHLQGHGCPKCANESNGERCRSSKEDFIKKTRKEHGDKYDYSKVEYVNCDTKVCINCREHGEFWQTPNNHINGSGCPKCDVENRSDKRTLTKEEFVKKALKVHGDKYDYSKVEYVGSKTKVCIICSEHGEFYQRPGDHLKSCGCPKCKADKTRERCTLTKEEVIKKFREKHNDKYDYTQVNYVNNATKVCIICSEHGEFWQTSHKHTQGQGCPTCGVENTREKNTSTKEDFIKKAREVHGDKYDYTKVEYVNCDTKVCIICPDHGEFWQIPHVHLRGSGCPKCGGHYVPTTEEWIAFARKIHGDKYEYAKVNYVDNVTKVLIICPEHGEFWQRPSAHTKGMGCPKCNLSHLERDVMNYLDEVGITYDYQKRFDWLGKQSLDFYLPDYNVGIECQGGQHFFPIDFAGKGVEWACEHFKYVISLDKRKKALCDKHGIKLLYFGNVPNYDTFLGEAVHDDVQFLIDYLEEHKKTIDHAQTIQVDV